MDKNLSLSDVNLQNLEKITSDINSVNDKINSSQFEIDELIKIKDEKKKIHKSKVLQLYILDDQKNMKDHQIGWLSYKNGILEDNFALNKYDKNREIIRYKRDSIK